jgi:SAM-dependent methyltransferase
MNSSSLTELLAALLCPRCNSYTPLQYSDGNINCACGHKIEVRDHIVQYSDTRELTKLSAVRVRDEQAIGYLQHAKFPIQLFRVRQFLDALPAHVLRSPALELGCGPGPYTAILLERGYRVLAIDYSEASLTINRDINRNHLPNVLFINADLNSIRLVHNSAKLLIMCDVLQHIGSLDARNSFLNKSFEALAPDGHFYLTFFNFNIKNYFKGDLHGSFAGGNLRYERLLFKEIVRSFPSNLRVDSITPTNIFHAALPDRLICALPGAQYLARMIAIAGKKSAH